LLTAIPLVEAEAPDPRRPRLRVLAGDIPSPRNPPPGCVFNTRCPMRQPICAEQEPPLREVAPDRFSRCHFDVQDLRSGGADGLLGEQQISRIQTPG
jgi:oligopeptide/dipeptide ABC transporter ATP-binding protein